ncbi:hypothetical protein MTO96_043364 [Rhipicephalus appendiculatus]
MQLLADALRVNSTLEEIELSGRRSLPFGGILGLCSSLAENKTLKKLALGTFRATAQEREALAQTLATSNSYGRVQMTWAKPDVNGLWNVLISPTASPEEVGFFSHSQSIKGSPRAALRRSCFEQARSPFRGFVGREHSGKRSSFL